MVSVSSGYVSITGNFRENNEDNGLVDSQSRFFIVADGMGGQAAGEKASELATQLISDRLAKLIDFGNANSDDVRAAIDKAVSTANTEIMALGEVDPRFHNMGTTVVLLVMCNDRIFIGNVGDSRAYLLRNGKLQQLTKDHSLVQALIDAGTITPADAENHRFRNVLYRYLGTKEGNNGADVSEHQPQPGDRFVLCSDGVTDGVDNAVLQQILGDAADAQSAAQKLVDAALEGGSKDNITSLTLFVEAAST